MNLYTAAPGFVLLLGSGYFGIRAFRLLFRMWKDSPARYRRLSLPEQMCVVFLLPTRNREFMKYVFLNMILFLAGLALLSMSLPKATP